MLSKSLYICLCLSGGWQTSDVSNQFRQAMHTYTFRIVQAKIRLLSKVRPSYSQLPIHCNKNLYTLCFRNCDGIVCFTSYPSGIAKTLSIFELNGH